MTSTSSASARTFGTIGVIGLGTMGSAMAANLVKAGCRVHGFDVRSWPGSADRTVV